MQFERVAARELTRHLVFDWAEKPPRFSLLLHVTGKGLYACMFEGEEPITDPASQFDGGGVAHLFGKLNVLAKRAFPDFQHSQDGVTSFAFVES
jgi:hypothetical protein